MGYKMIVLDLDDTLLKNDRTISARTKKTLLEAQAAGVKVVLASGRPDFAVKPIAKELELEKHGGFIVSFNGAKITDSANGNELFSAGMSAEAVHKLFEMSKAEGAFIHTYIGDDIIASEMNEYTDIEKQITGMNIIVPSDFKAYIKNDVVKVIVLQSPEKIKAIEEKWKPIIKNELYMTTSKPFFLEFMNPSVDKGKSVLRLAQMLQISAAEIIAFGDSCNDISMLEAAGTGVAMENAVERVKSIADYVTASNENDGVALAVERFVLNK